MKETKEWKSGGEMAATRAVSTEQKIEKEFSANAYRATGVHGQRTTETAPLKKVKRRSGRVKMEMPILLMGSDGEGRVFSEETRTVVISQHGAGVVSRQKLVAEQEVVMRTRPSGREAVVRVVGEIGVQGTQHTYGLAFMDERLP